MDTKQISEKIKETVRPLMVRWENDMLSHIKQLQQYCCYDVYKENPDADTYKIHDLKTGKGWNKSIDNFFHRSEKELKEKLHKEAEAKLTKIDVAVNKKLKAVEVETVKNLYFNMNGADYYAEGGWAINSEKVFSFRTIYAGGYNIQCLHIRTIYKYK